MPRYKRCNRCNGKGYIEDGNFDNCPKCGGTGEVRLPERRNISEKFREMVQEDNSEKG